MAEGRDRLFGAAPAQSPGTGPAIGPETGSPTALARALVAACAREIDRTIVNAGLIGAASAAEKRDAAAKVALDAFLEALAAHPAPEPDGPRPLATLMGAFLMIYVEAAQDAGAPIDVAALSLAKAFEQTWMSCLGADAQERGAAFETGGCA